MCKYTYTYIEMYTYLHMNVYILHIPLYMNAKTMTPEELTAFIHFLSPA